MADSKDRFTSDEAHMEISVGPDHLLYMAKTNKG